MARLLMALLGCWLGGVGATPAASPLPDPMAPPLRARASSEAPSPAEDPARVTAIKLRGARPLALVGTQWLSVGARLDKATVLSIDERGVRFQVEGQTVLVPLGQSLAPMSSPPSSSP